MQIKNKTQHKTGKHKSVCIALELNPVGNFDIFYPIYKKGVEYLFNIKCHLHNPYEYLYIRT